MATSLDSLIVTLEARDEKFSAALKNIEAQMAKTEQRINASTKTIEDRFTGLSTTIARARTAFATLGVSIGVSQVVQAADTYRLLEGRLKLVTSSSTELAQVQERLFAVAQETRSSFAGTVDLYASLARTTKDLGLGQEQLASITKTVNQAIQISGVSATSAQAALIQLGQGFAAGALRGEELNSVMEQTPRLALAIAEGLGVGLGELRRMGQEGELTADRIISALERQGNAIQSEFSALPVTVGSALTKLGNSLLQFVGQLDQATGASSTFARGIEIIASTVEGVTERVVIALEALQLEKIYALKQAIADLEQEAQNPSQKNFLVSFVDSIFGSNELPIEQRLASLKEKLAALRSDFATPGNVDRWVQLSEASFMTEGALTKLSSTITQKFTPAQIEAQKEIQKNIDRLTQHAATLNLSGAALADFVAKQALAEGGSAALAESLRQAVLADEQAKAAKEGNTKATQEQAKAEREAVKIIEERNKALAQIDVYQKVATGVLTLEQAQKQLEEAELAVKLGSAALAKQFLDTKQAAEDYDAATQLIAQNEQQLAKIRADEEKAMEALAAQTQRTAAENQHLASIINSGIAAGRAYDDVLRDVAIRQKENELRAQGMAEGVREAATASVDAANAFAKAQENLEKFRPDKVDFADEIIDNFGDVLEGIRKGTRDIGDLLEGLEDTFVTTFIDMFAQAFKEKLDWEAELSNNLLNDLPAIFSQGGAASGTGFLNGLFSWIGQVTGIGQQVGTDFSQNAVKAAEITWQQGDIFGSGTGAGKGIGANAAQAGLSWGSIFGGIAAIAAGHAFGEGLRGALGVGQSKEGKIGAMIGSTVGGIAGFLVAGPLGGAVGSALGDLWGGFIIDALFGHTPTKGTQIRKAIDKYLTEIGVSFASQIRRGNYFFEETKALAEEMFGGDFLAASKKILNDKVGPELSKQFQALGLFLTADQAIDLGKDPEQSATTFGNMIAANLGTDAKVLQDAIDEIIEKGGISLKDIVDKLNSVFDQELISREFYVDAILGAVDIFTHDLPEAIGVSKIAMASFTEEGIFDLEVFQEKLEKSTALYNSIGQAAFEALVSPLTDGQALAQFDKSLDDIERDLIARQFLKDFEPKLFEGIDTSDGIGEEEAKLLRTRLAEGREELNKMITDAGLLPPAFEEAGNRIQQFLIDAVSLSPEDFNQAVDEFINGLLFDQITANFFDKEFFDNIFKDIDVTDGIGEEEAQLLADRLGLAKEELYAILDAAGLLEAEMDAAGKALLDAFDKAEAQLRTSIGNAIRDAIAKGGGRIDSVALEKQLKSDVAQAVIDGLIDGFLVGAILQPIIDAALKPLRDSVNTALEDGVVTAAEIAAILAVAGTALEHLPEALSAGLSIVTGIINSPEWKATLDAIRKASPGGGSSGGGGGAPAPEFGGRRGAGSTATDLNSILDAIDSFLGISNPARQITAEFDRLTQLIKDNSAALKAAGHDIDDLLDKLAKELPKAIEDAIEQANQSIRDASRALKDDILRLLTGEDSSLNAAQKSALLTQRIDQLRAQFNAATDKDERARLAGELSQLLQERLSISPLDRFGFDFRELFNQTIKELKLLDKDLIDSIKPKELKAQLTFNIHLPAGTVNDDATVRRVTKEMLPLIQEGASYYLDTAKGQNQVIKIVRAT